MEYCLALPPIFHHMNDVFYILVLRKYVHDPSHILDWHQLQVTDEGNLKAQLV